MAYAYDKQIIYFVFGPLTIAWGVMIILGVPSSPMNAWFLNEREKKIATARVSNTDWS